MDFKLIVQLEQQDFAVIFNCEGVSLVAVEVSLILTRKIILFL